MTNLYSAAAQVGRAKSYFAFFKAFGFSFLFFIFGIFVFSSKGKTEKDTKKNKKTGLKIILISIIFVSLSYFIHSIKQKSKFLAANDAF